jgi:hypothetical protein
MALAQLQVRGGVRAQRTGRKGTLAAVTCDSA